MNDPLGLFGEEENNNDPLGLFEDAPEKKQASWGTAIKRAGLNAVNAIDAGFSLPAGALASVFSEEEGDRIFREMDQRIAQNTAAGRPDEETSLAQDALGMTATLPLQMFGMAGQPAMKGRQFIQNGEDVGRAQLATLAETGATAAGLGPMMPVASAAGRFALGAGTNMIMGAGADAASNLLAEQEATKQQYNPYDMRARMLEGLVGGVSQAAMGERPMKPQMTAGDVNAVKGALDNPAAVEAPVAPDMAPYKPNDGLDGQMNLFDPEVEGRGISPYEAVPGDWRIDENGMPVKADLSMDVQNMQQPLQRNLWGDELEPAFPRDPNATLEMDGDIQGHERFSRPVNFKNDPENQRPLTEAIDSMAAGDRTAALEQTKMGRPMVADGPMERAKMLADIEAASGDNLRGFNAKMRKQGGGLLIGNKKVDVVPTEDGFKAVVDGKDVGYLRSNLTPEQRAQLGETANVDMVKVNDDFKGKGVGKALYDAWTKANDGNVAPSGKTSPSAWKVWKRDNAKAVDAFVEQEQTRIADGAPAEQVLSNITDPEVRSRVAGFNSKKQSGGVLFDWKKKPAVDKIEKIGAIKKALNAFVPTEMTPDAVIEVAKGMKDVDQNFIQRASNMFTKGGLYQAEKTGNPIVKYTVDKVLNADRKTRADVRDYVHDSLAPSMRALNNKELTSIAQVMNYADLKQVELTPEFLRENGFNQKQIDLAVAHRKTMDFAFDSLNRAREAAGLKPITKRTAYAAMAATGDFQKLVYALDDSGEKSVVGIIGAKTRAGLESLQKKVTKEGYTFGEERYAGSGRERTGSGVAAMMQALEHLADNDPKSQAFLDVLADLKTNEAYDFLNAKKHTLGKKGVFGMEGRKNWESDYKNAKDFMDSQLHYAESAIRWGHLSEASLGVKEVLAGDTGMPNAKKWSESYFQNALGLNPSETGRAFEKALGTLWKDTGIGSTIPRTTIQYSRKAVNTLLLGLRPSFLAANIVQPLVSMPGMASFLQSRGVDTMTTGFDGIARGGFAALKEKLGGMSKLEADAFQYAKDNHVYGTDLVDTSNLSRKGGEYYVDKAGNFLASNIESGTRKMVYYAFVHILNDNGVKDFGLAQNLTDMAMNNYSPVERPQVFNTLGPIGDMAANLSSFKHNELSRIAMFAREIGKNKNAAPFLTQMAATVAAAGIQGVVLYEEADWFYKQITKAMGKPDSLGRVVLDFSEKMNSMAQGVSTKIPNAPYALSHGAFSMLGIDMSKGLGISDTIPNSLGEAAFPGGSKLVDIAGAGLSAISDPSEMNLKRLAREVSPGGITGLMDRNWFSEQTPAGELGQNRRTLEGQIIRTDADKMAKNFGFTGIHESVGKQKLYDISQRNLAFSDMRTSVLKKMNDSVKSTGKVTPQQIENYLNYEGDPSTIASDIASMLEKQQIDAVTAARLKAAMAKSVPQLRNAERTLQTLGNYK